MDVMDTTIYDWKQKVGDITYNEGMQYSSNVLMMILQDKVGADKMLDYYQKFGFGQTTGSEFPTESAGQMPGTMNYSKNNHLTDINSYPYTADPGHDCALE